MASRRSGPVLRARIFMAIDLVIWYIRILYFFAAYEALGPKLTMIYEMVGFMCIRSIERIWVSRRSKTHC